MDICNFRALRIKSHDSTSVMGSQDDTYVLELPKIDHLRKRPVILNSILQCMPAKKLYGKALLVKLLSSRKGTARAVAPKPQWQAK